jgi:hypothetical protein
MTGLRLRDLCHSVKYERSIIRHVIITIFLPLQVKEYEHFHKKNKKNKISYEKKRTNSINYYLYTLEHIR